MSVWDRENVDIWGHLAAHSPPPPAADRPLAAVPGAENGGYHLPAAGLGAELEEREAIAGADAEQLDLLGEAAEIQNARRRGPGRPAGAGNLRNAQTFDYLEALGFKAPERMLMELVAADPRELAAKLAGQARTEAVSFERAIEVLKLQIRAAADLMPYKLARKPQALEISRKELHLFVAGTLSDDQKSLIEQNQWLSLGDGVGLPSNASHDEANSEADQGVKPGQADD